jgi:hypothetical protein
MRTDIGRELAWVRTDRPRTRREWIERRVLRLKPRGAGNLLCALGLFVYTEAIGRVWRWNVERESFFTAEGFERPGKNFYAAFDRLDAGAYGAWRKPWERSAGLRVYDVLRSGLVHEYEPKIKAAIYLGHDEPRGVDYRDSRMWVFVVPYFEHFRALADELRAELLARPNPTMPEPFFGPNVPPPSSGLTTSGSSER